MPSYEYAIDEASRAGARFVARVNEEIQRAVATEKSQRKITQQAIADKLGVNRSVVNRRVMGLENLTARSIGELLWAIGWEPLFEARKPAASGQNEAIETSSESFQFSQRKADSVAGHSETVRFKPLAEAA